MSLETPLNVCIFNFSVLYSLMNSPNSNTDEYEQIADRVTVLGLSMNLGVVLLFLMSVKVQVNCNRFLTVK